MLAAILLAAGCAASPLDLADEVTEAAGVDDELVIEGNYCASPAADLAYPVKILFIVDGSGSQQFSDQNRQRVVAVEEAVNALVGLPNTYFSIIVFNATVRATPSIAGNPPPPVFTNDLDEIVRGLADLAQADTVTDYQGALGLAYAQLLRDMTDTQLDPGRGPAELGRTKYVVIFISDGFPDPQCHAGLGNDFDPNFPGGINLLCESQDYINCLLEAPGTTCANGICDYNGMLCYQTADAATFLGGIDNTELAAGLDYNQPYQILQKVQDLMDLALRFQVGAIALHAGLVLDPLADPAIIRIFGDPTQAIPLLQQMAAIGGGTYMEFYGGDQIDFLQVNFDALKQQRVVRGFFADNLAAVTGEGGLLVDTDQDGLADVFEIEIGSHPYRADSDGDGYGDLLEWQRRSLSFDVNDPCLPPVIDVPGVPAGTACDPAAPFNCNYQMVAGPNGPRRRYTDADRDGLHDCEERQLGTNPRSPDSDGDGVPDGVELRFGLDPARWDTEDDTDRDSVPNGREVYGHLSPKLAQTERAARDRYRYDRRETSRTADGRSCYEFSVRGLRLVATERRDDPAALAGENDIRLYILENVADNLAGDPLVRTACVRARYVPPTLKEPASGEVQLLPDDFRYLLSEDEIFDDPAILQQLFDPETGCVAAP